MLEAGGDVDDLDLRPGDGGPDLQYKLYSPGHQPLVHALDYRFNRHLWHTRVIDANGIQLLREDHLSHAHSLTDWNITHVSADRYLVETKDLTPWYAHDAPDPDTLTQARHDFGDMILTWDHIRATPGPYSKPGPGLAPTTRT